MLDPRDDCINFTSCYIYHDVLNKCREMYLTRILRLRKMQKKQNVKNYDYMAYVCIYIYMYIFMGAPSMFLVPVVWSADTHLRSSLPRTRISQSTSSTVVVLAATPLLKGSGWGRWFSNVCHVNLVFQNRGPLK